MTRSSESIDARYDAMMFARTPEAARLAAVELVRAVLGDEAVRRPIREALRECCRVIRPAKDLKDQSRFEEEFIELALWPGKSHQIAA